jgi:hypothetical protein
VTQSTDRTDDELTDTQINSIAEADEEIMAEATHSTTTLRTLMGLGSDVQCTFTRIDEQRDAAGTVYIFSRRYLKQK